MAKKVNERRCVTWIVILVGILSFLLSYMFVSVILKRNEGYKVVSVEQTEGGCCGGIEGVVLWGDVVTWGYEFKFGSSFECCDACKATCDGEGACLCDTWVYCGSPHCGERFGECWLKKQNDLLDPDWQEASDYSIWTSGFIFGNVEAIVKMETKYGTLHIKLLPECAPYSYKYTLELLESRHCVGCRFFRAEGRGPRGHFWDSKGNRLNFIQGTLEAEGVEFKKIPMEACSVIQRGSVAWIGSGPEFFISLGNHQEWTKTYMVFGYVLPEDMRIAEKIASLPTVPDVWNNINVSVLEKPVSFWFQRIK